MSTNNASNKTIKDGGTLDGTAIGVTTPAVGNFGATVVSQLDINVGASGNPKIVFDINGTDEWHVGVDDNDDDNFIIGLGATVGTTPVAKLGNNTSYPLNVNNGLIHEVCNIHTDRVALSGAVTWVNVVSVARGSYIVHVSTTGNDSPAGTFCVSASQNGCSGSTTSVVNRDAGYSGGNVNARLSGNYIQVTKDTTNYDNNYTVVVMGVKG